MALVHFDPEVGGSGLKVSDDGDPATGLLNYGWTQRFVPALQQQVAVAAWMKDWTLARHGEITGAASAADTSATAAAASAVLADQRATTAGGHATAAGQSAGAALTSAQAAAASATAAEQAAAGNMLDDGAARGDRAWSSAKTSDELEGRAAANHTHPYLPLAGGAMTGSISYGNVDAGTWARGLDGRRRSNNALLGGVGVFGAGDDVTAAYVGLGANPWNSNSDSGIVVRQNGVEIKGKVIGTAVTQSALDTTSERLLKVGDFGIGTQAVALGHNAGDWNAATLGGAQYMGYNCANAPVSGRWFIGTALRHNQNFVVQELIDFAVSPQRKYFRALVDGTWTTWRQVYRSDTILGAVSQSGGVPTGAIIERGSNSNGQYTKFADGTLICRTRGMANQGEAVWVFPAPFADAPTVSLTPHTGGVLSLAPRVSALSATQLNWAVFTTSDTRSSQQTELFVIGRWF